MKLAIHKKICLGLLCAVLLIFTAFSAIPRQVAYAANTEIKFDETNVLDDLKSSTINGKPFNILNYPFDSTGVVKHPEIINVVEYCYSYKINLQSNYGLYLYFYNPQGLYIDEKSLSNKVQLAVSYKKDNDGNVIPDGYEKFDLQFCSKVEESKYKNLFYKYKVIDRKSADGKTILQRVNSNARRYDISDIKLHTKGNANATDYTVGGTYIFTGYVKGYGADINADNNLTCEVRNLETIRLDLTGETDSVDKRTYWRSNSSSLGAHHQNQINSVFFAIDKNVLEKYGYTLQRIKAEWWEYKTRPAVVIDNLDVHNRLLNYNGVKISESYDRARGFIIKYYESIIDGFKNYGWSWNGDLNSTGVNITLSDDIETLLPLLFYTDGIDVDDYILLPETLQKYFETYNKSYEKGHLIINGGHDYSADLFDDFVDDGRTCGKNERVFDIGNPDDFWDIRSYDSTFNWWDKLWDYGFGSITTNDDYPDVAPIQMLKPEDMAVSNLSDSLKINPNDVQRLKDYYNSNKKDSEVFIFRYAQTDYFATDLDIYDITNDKSYNSGVGSYDKHVAELRQGTQFFDFDILEFTFNKDGVYTVIPVVSSPIDHWSGYTPSVEPDKPDWLKWILIALAVILLCVLLAPLLPKIFEFLLWLIKGIWAIITWPFKAISKAIKKRKNKTSNGS